jgi:hypothetical protein
MKLPRVAWLLAFSLVCPVVWGQTGPRRVRITIQPDCFRASLTAACDPRKSGSRLDLGPQIAVWVESLDGTQFIETLMVTNLVAVRGLGNRPGHWSLPSSPKFPYGKRSMSLPVWAHRRGKLYDTVVMQDGVEKEYWLGFHEGISSPDPYYCRPMSYEEIDVDAVSCPTKVFNSAKGRFFDANLDLAPQHRGLDGQVKDYVPPAKSYYPPRRDLQNFTDRDCDEEAGGTGCPMSARSFAAINDLDAVATATPPYGRPFTKTWLVPDQIPDGEYALFVEVSKEFDNNAHHAYTAYQDPLLADSGLRNNFGQPSVVYRLPFRVSRTAPSQSAGSQVAGYGSWNGASGMLYPPDHTIGDAPGSGRGRLLSISVPSIEGGAPLVGRVHAIAEPIALPTPLPDGAAPPDAPADAPASLGKDGGAPSGSEAGEPARTPDAGAPPTVCKPVRFALGALTVPPGGLQAETAAVLFVEPTGGVWGYIDEYEIRFWAGSQQSAEAFRAGIPVEVVSRAGAGQERTVSVKDLRSETEYTVGVRAQGYCIEADISYVTFTTGVRNFTQLSGCFVATAAWGSHLAAEVDVLRRVRDRARAGSGLFAAVADAYARSSPPLADTLESTEAGRAVVRRVLAPLVELSKQLESLARRR